MTRRIAFLRLAASLGLALAPVASWSREAPQASAPSAAVRPNAAAREELRDRLRGYLRARLRSEVGLTDEQMVAVAPRLEELERARGEFRRERARRFADLRRGLRRGADDAECAEALRRLDDAQSAHDRRSREILRQIDEALSVRQRAELRIFLERFRTDLQHRVDEVRRAGPGPRGRGAP